jgi:hypothetical protein
MATKLDTMPEAEAIERRKITRHRTLKAGSINFNKDGSIDCRVRNLSDSGALLEVASQVGIPDDFVLVIEIDHFEQPCHVIWRTLKRLGVVFTDADAAEVLAHPAP